MPLSASYASFSFEQKKGKQQQLVFVGSLPSSSCGCFGLPFYESCLFSGALLHLRGIFLTTPGKGFSTRLPSSTEGIVKGLLIEGTLSRLRCSGALHRFIIAALPSS